MARPKKNEISLKTSLRKQLKALLHSLPPERKEEALNHLYTSLSRKFHENVLILSYVSMKDELSTTLLNQFLALNGRLVLPKVDNDTLALYRVTDLDSQLVCHGLYPLLEPDPTKTQKIAPQDISYALIPALGFDDQGYRLGYGMGYYDRLLPLLCFSKIIGIGYKEQLLPHALPRESHDQPVEVLALY